VAGNALSRRSRAEVSGSSVRYEKMVHVRTCL